MASRAKTTRSVVVPEAIAEVLRHLETAVKSSSLRSAILDVCTQCLGFLHAVRRHAESCLTFLKDFRKLRRGIVLTRTIKLCLNTLYSLSWMLAHDLGLPYFTWALPCYRISYTWPARLARLVLTCLALYESYRRCSCPGIPPSVSARGTVVQLLSPEITRKYLDIVAVLESAGVLLVDLEAITRDYPWLRLLKRGHSQSLRWLLLASSTPRLESWLRHIRCVYLYVMPLLDIVHKVLTRIAEVLTTR